MPKLLQGTSWGLLAISKVTRCASTPSASSNSRGGTWSVSRTTWQREEACSKDTRKTNTASRCRPTAAPNARSSCGAPRAPVARPPLRASSTAEGPLPGCSCGSGGNGAGGTGGAGDATPATAGRRSEGVMGVGGPGARWSSERRRTRLARTQSCTTSTDPRKQMQAQQNCFGETPPPPPSRAAALRDGMGHARGEGAVA
mmetsp:Transcript_102662/g.306602  ORF Transcript_102662/g.306602 Transcript_102662/m.306602 type:complete len:200 (-) Transcript_102662:43-642(-)